MTKDEGKARAAFTAARADQQKRVDSQPDYGPAVCVLAVIDAALGRKEEALREGQRAIELLPVEKDQINGTHMIEFFAIAAAWVGEKNLACDKLATAVRLPGTISYGQLKLLPYWDPLRGDPRFEKIVNSLAPKLSIIACHAKLRSRSAHGCHHGGESSLILHRSCSQRRCSLAFRGWHACHHHDRGSRRKNDVEPSLATE